MYVSLVDIIIICVGMNNDIYDCVKNISKFLNIVDLIVIFDY